MNAEKDYYAILGVSPEAADIVIRAAYKALAQRYHPDRFSGAIDEANRRMTEINEAYAVLSNAKARAEFDQMRGKGAKSGADYFREEKDEPPEGVDPLAKDWSLALAYYPDLAQIDARLAQISWRLAYSFRAYLLETKEFKSRVRLAQVVEAQFLQAYFGTNPVILKFATALVMEGNKPVALALNQVIRVLGSDVEADDVIKKITKDFRLDETGARALRAKRLRRLAEAISENPNFTSIDQKIDLVTQWGAKFQWDGGFFSKSCTVTMPFGSTRTFADGRAFGVWLMKEVIPEILASS